MSDNEIEQLIKDKSEISKQIMRDISDLCQKLNEAREADFVGISDGWEYSFTRQQKQEAEDLN